MKLFAQTLIIPKFQLPRFVGTMGRILPQWPHAMALVAGLNLTAKMKLLPVDTLETLEGKTFRVTVKDTGGEANFTFRDGLFRTIFNTKNNKTRSPDLAFSANLSTYIQLVMRQEDPDTLFFNRELDIAGDTELGLIVKNMLDAVEWPVSPLEKA